MHVSCGFCRILSPHRKQLASGKNGRHLSPPVLFIVCPSPMLGIRDLIRDSVRLALYYVARKMTLKRKALRS